MNFIFSEIEFKIDQSLYIVGIVTFVIFLLIFVINSKLHNKKIKKIIQSQKEKKKITPLKKTGKKASSKVSKINRTPFRERNSGVTWGGGNIKGANAQRGTKREFLKKN